jgi:hypothetical protein
MFSNNHEYFKTYDFEFKNIFFYPVTIFQTPWAFNEFVNLYFFNRKQFFGPSLFLKYC